MVSMTMQAGRKPVIMAVLAGIACAATISLLPAPILERLVLESGLPSVLAVSEPPLGMTARASLGLSAGLIVAFAAWIVLSFVESKLSGDADLAYEEGLENQQILRISRGEDGPILRPIFAQSDLGAPFNSVTADAQVLDLGALPLWAGTEDNEMQAIEATDADFEEIDSEAEEKLLWQPDPWFDELQDPEPALSVPVASEKIIMAPAESLSLGELVARLEAGIQRRKTVVSVESVSYMRAPPAQTMDEALREALGTLQRMASRSR